MSVFGVMGFSGAAPSHHFPFSNRILSAYRKEDGYYGTRVDRSNRTHDDLVQPQDHHPRGGLERGDQEEGELRFVSAPDALGSGPAFFGPV